MADKKTMTAAELDALRGLLRQVISALTEFSFREEVLEKTLKDALKKVAPQYDFEAKYRANYSALRTARRGRYTKLERQQVQLVDALIQSLESRPLKKMRKVRDRLLKLAADYAQQQKKGETL
jgi:hypothetical protein